jgi:signal transduction histidine kinase
MRVNPFSLNHHLIDKHGSTIGKRLAVLQNLLIVSLGSTTLFFLIDLFNRTEVPLGIYIFVFVSCLIDLFFVRRGYSKLATVLFMCIMNGVLYTIMSSEPMRTGFHLHLITIGFAAAVLFGYKERNWGLSFAATSCILYIISFTVDYSPLPFRNYATTWVLLFFFINATLFILISLYLFTMLMDLNYRAETSIVESNRQSLLQNQQLSKANEELDRFVFSASNDLRAPLTSISGLIHLAQTDPSAQLDYLQMMKGRIMVMEGFIKEIIDFSRNARLELDYSTIQVNSLVNEVIASLTHLNEFDKVNYEINIDKEQVVYSDLARLKIALTNIITNAIQYSDFSKAKSFIKIKSEQDADSLKITVEDNGIGVATEQQSKIFDMFHRASDRSKGFGLGLYIAKETITKLNGKIDFKSEVNVGSQFALLLPNNSRTSTLISVG